MIELLATIIITASSALLFGYWFRYTCLLILSAKTTRDYACDFAAANQLSFLDVEAQLRSGNATDSDMDGLRRAIDHDYAVVTYLLDHVSAKSSGTDSVEFRMLEINYRVMGAWYAVSKRFSSTTAMKALEEMTMVVAHFANTMGERAEAAAAA
jgi:hypothetical protein